MNELSKRKQIRLKNYDYSQNVYYFITICTHNRQEILSKICDNDVERTKRRLGVMLQPIGKIAENEIKELTKRYQIEIDAYVIMPNHIHLLLKMNGKQTEQSLCTKAEQSPATTVADVICTFKSLTTKIVNKNDNCIGHKIWQRSYFEHIIRSESDYIEVTEYIRNNPTEWKNTCRDRALLCPKEI